MHPRVHTYKEIPTRTCSALNDNSIVSCNLSSGFPSTILPAGTTLAVSINNSEETLPAEGESQVARPMNVSVGIVISFCGTQNCSLLWVPFPGSYVAMLCPLGVPGSIDVFIFGSDKRCSVLDVYIPDTQVGVLFGP